MALRTAGSSTTVVLRTLQWVPGMSQIDIAAFNALCKDDVNIAHPVMPNRFVAQGILYVPNRQPIYLRPNDWVVVDPATGFPFVLANGAMSGANWIHT